uniref:C2H2-type domain-containing protein n=1 Tax=Acrobeloides nanus TaxID=290746 RepID=A0A914E5T2_9BILA
MQTGSEGHDKENDLKIMQNLASAFPQMFMGPLGVGQQQGQQNQSQQNGSSQQQQQQDQQQLELQQLMMATLDQMNSNPQNSLQNLYLQQLMSLGGLVKSDTSPDSQQSTTPTAENTGNDEMANFMASLIASTTAPTTTTTPAVNSASLLDQLSIMQNLFGGNAPTTTASTTNPFTSTPSATSQGQTNSGVSTPMTPNGQSQQQNAAAVFSAAGNAGLLNSPSGIMSGIGGFMSPNKDSYCELCDKNFCNRYFLRTHKMKKHGIGMGPNDDGTTSPSKLPGLPFPLSLQNGSSPKSTHQASVIVNGSSGDEQSSPLSKMPKLSFPGAPELERRGSNDASAVFDAAFNAPKPSLDSILAFTNASSPTHATTCDICGRQFSSVLAVFTHKAREHAQGVNAGDNALLSIMEQLNQTPSKPSDERSICELCDKEFESRQHLLQHQLLQHGSTNANHPTTPSQQAQAHAQAQAQAHQAAATNALLSMLPGGFPPLPFLLPPSLPQGFASLADLDPTGAFAAFNGNSPGGNLNSGGNKMAPKRQYSSTSKNFCDLCNKEVCNKYFLRTHMLKMHNIVIDENKTVIASIDTLEKEKLGALSFRCDICHMELKTRQTLREHKKTTHGVMPLMTPPGNRGGSVKTGSALNSAASSAGSNSNGTAFDFTNKALMDMQNDADADGNQDMGMDE